MIPVHRLTPSRTADEQIDRSWRDLLHVPLAVADPEPDAADATVGVLR
jgi:hypothetical protein